MSDVPLYILVHPLITRRNEFCCYDFCLQSVQQKERSLSMRHATFQREEERKRPDQLLHRLKEEEEELRPTHILIAQSFIHKNTIRILTSIFGAHILHFI
jgi:hypothetical protein